MSKRGVRAMEAEAGGMFLSWLGKLPGLAARLALVLEFSGGRAIGQTPPPVDRSQALLASHGVSRLCKPMADGVRRCRPAAERARRRGSRALAAGAVATSGDCERPRAAPARSCRPAMPSATTWHWPSWLKPGGFGRHLRGAGGIGRIGRSIPPSRICRDERAARPISRYICPGQKCRNCQKPSGPRFGTFGNFGFRMCKEFWNRHVVTLAGAISSPTPENERVELSVGLALELGAPLGECPGCGFTSTLTPTGRCVPCTLGSPPAEGWSNEPKRQGNSLCWMLLSELGKLARRNRDTRRIQLAKGEPAVPEGVDAQDARSAFICVWHHERVRLGHPQLTPQQFTEAFDKTLKALLGRKIVRLADGRLLPKSKSSA